MESCLKRKHNHVTAIKAYTYLKNEEDLYLNIPEEYNNKSNADILYAAFCDVVHVFWLITMWKSTGKEVQYFY